LKDPPSRWQLEQHFILGLDFFRTRKGQKAPESIYYLCGGNKVTNRPSKNWEAAGKDATFIEKTLGLDLAMTN
jgi:hypothetical protein